MSIFKLLQFTSHQQEPKKGRLNDARVYLGGAIDRDPTAGREWREDLSKWLKTLGITPINPLDKPCNIGIEDNTARQEIEQLKEEGRFEEIRAKYKIIRDIDLRLCDVSDFGIFRIDIDIHAAGTYEELSVMNRSKKPTLVWIVQGRKYCPNWLTYMLPHQFIFGSSYNMKKYIEYAHTANNVDDLERWRFLDFSNT